MVFDGFRTFEFGEPTYPHFNYVIMSGLLHLTSVNLVGPESVLCAIAKLVVSFVVEYLDIMVLAGGIGCVCFGTCKGGGTSDT